MQVQYNKQVFKDLEKEVKYYKAISNRLSDRFIEEHDKAISTILRNPYRNHIRRDGIRFQNMKRFPFQVLYRMIDNNTVRILVIRNTSRHPSFGLDRD